MLETGCFMFVNGDLPGAILSSNPFSTLIFRYNFSQQSTDLIESVALEQAALGAL